VTRQRRAAEEKAEKKRLTGCAKAARKRTHLGGKNRGSSKRNTEKKRLTGSAKVAKKRSHLGRKIRAGGKKEVRLKKNGLTGGAEVGTKRTWPRRSKPRAKEV
jgi:hypothetical protein